MQITRSESWLPSVRTVKAMFDFWKDELTEQEENDLLDRATAEIRKRKLEAPAIVALEMHKPLAYVGSQAAVAFSPFMVPFFGFDAVNDYSRLLSKRGSVERLITRLEKAAETPAESKEN